MIDGLAIVGASGLHHAGGPATAVAMKAGAISYIGSDAGAAAAVSPRDTLDLRAAGLDSCLIAPAFTDAHLHTVQAGQVILGLDLHDIGSRTDLLEAVARHAAARPQTKVLFGQGWDERSWPDPTPPTRTELDRAGAGAAVYLARVDVHSAVVSTALLDRLPEVRQAPGYGEDGLVNREAHHLCRGALERFFTDAERREAAAATLRRCAELGVGAVHDLGGPHLGPVADLDRVRDAAAEFGIQVVGYWGTLADEASLALAREHALHGLAGDLCIDGAIGSRTAALIADYEDAPSHGFRYLTDDEIRDHLVACTRAGLQAGFHCIGDDAVRAAVHGLKRAAELVGAAALRKARHRLEHVEMIDPDDAQTLADLHVTASVQPAFDAAWGGPGELYEQRLGRARSGRMNPFGSLHRVGVPLAFGTDAPVTPPAGWATVSAAVSHSRADERMGMAAAFRAATQGGYAAAGEPGGLLEVGQPAAVAVWDCSGLEVDQTGLPVLASGEPRCVALAVGGRLTVFDPDLDEALTAASIRPGGT
jgi:predicted amidohydrolase YtcJ